MHLLIPFAAAAFPQGLPTLHRADLPHLRAVLTQLVPAARALARDDHFSMPHERVRAVARGWADCPDGCLPWAAAALADEGRTPGDRAYAWISPVHLVVGSAQVTLVHPDTLDFQEDESRAFLAAMEPYFAQDDIRLGYASPGRWLAEGPVFDGLACVSPDRVAGQDIRPWLPRPPMLRRLQNEMQMLLYTHAANDARTARGAVPINSFWVHGSGRLPSVPATAPRGDLLEDDTLRASALQQDARAWQQAWSRLDAGAVRVLRDALADPTRQATLTLCGLRGSATFGPARRGWLQRLPWSWRPSPLDPILATL